MRENESEPGDRRETPGFPWTHPQPDDDTIAFGNAPSYEPPDYGPPGYGPPGYGPHDYGQPYEPPPPRPTRTGRLLIYLVVAAVAAGIGAGATVLFNHDVTASSAGVSAHEIPAGHDDVPGFGDSTLNQSRIESRVEPGLVDITATLKYQSETAEGTGMILSSNGLVLTNNHVIDNSTSVTVTPVDSGRNYQARVIGYDSTHDVALLQLEGASGLRTVSFGNSGRLDVGTAVLALGDAQGKGGVTPAPGIIDALNRSINASDQGSGTTENLHGMEQTSAQIQEGDSGGALADNSGQVVGMITAANTSSTQPGGTIGFAIPINTALSIARQIAGGDHTATDYIGVPGFLGVIVPNSNSTSPRQEARDERSYLQHDSTYSPAAPPGGMFDCIDLDTQVSSVPTRLAPVKGGVLIIDVLCNTAANRIGLQAGDVVTAVNGHPVTAPPTLGAYLSKFHPGNTVKLSWTDIGGGKHTAELTLSQGPVR
jgi:S1-C subfamily serine protease